MSLSSIMAADVSAVFLNTDDFGQAATFLALNGATAFACTVMPTDPNPSMVQISEGTESRRESRFLASLSVLRAGILADLGTARDPGRGDAVTIASGADAGTWVVRTISADTGDGVVMDCILSDMHSLYGAGAVENR